jgi:3-hydroxyacyl-CoA dehydrogenase/enoyl-CoA hydratase/3-hydroxybutyryl-CoA epimerase
VRSPRDGDLGAIFGIGYPPFRGGPLRYLDALGAAQAVETLEDLAATVGPRFEPAQVLRDQARTGTGFYSS